MGGEDCPAPGQSIGSSCIDPDIMAALNVLRCFALKAGQIDALLICTCTGYLCPGVTSYVAEQLGLRSNALLQDLALAG